MTVHDAMPELRASDADREATVERLRRAAIEGRLDADELDERLSAAYGARLCSDLARLTADVTAPPAEVKRREFEPALPAPRRRINLLAAGSLLSALFWGLWIGSLGAIVLGHIALQQIAESEGRQSGRGLAIAGLALGYLAMLPMLFFLLALVSGF